jgi:hypothetical protein
VPPAEVSIHRASAMKYLRIVAEFIHSPMPFTKAG